MSLKRLCFLVVNKTMSSLIKNRTDVPSLTDLTYKLPDKFPVLYPWWTVDRPLRPEEVPPPPRGKMTRRKRVRLRKKYNRLRRLAKVGKVRLVIRSAMSAPIVVKEDLQQHEFYRQPISQLLDEEEKK